MKLINTVGRFRFALVLFVGMFIFVNVSIAAAAEPIKNDIPPTFDWQRLMTIVVPTLVFSVSTFLIALARYFWQKIALERPDIFDLIRDGVMWAAPVVEQLRKRGTVKSVDEALKTAHELTVQFLLVKGVKIEVINFYADLIDKAIEGAVHAINRDGAISTLDIFPQK